jgi:hypothetical protein
MPLATEATIVVVGGLALCGVIVAWVRKAIR